MIVLCVTNCPPALRGDLSKWMNEVNTGVYVGKLNAKVRDELWDRVCDHIKNGQATMVYSTNNEQGYAFRTHHTAWIPVDYEGITLMKKPFAVKSGEESSFLQPGFSKAAKYEKLKHLKTGKEVQEYVIVDVETTGLDYNQDKIIEVGLLKIGRDGIKEQFQCFVQTDKVIPENVANLTGITNEMIQQQGITEEDAVDKIIEFIGTDLIVGYNVQFDIRFLQKLGERVGKNITIRKTKDVLQIARRELDDLKDYKLETVASHFSLDIGDVHRALEDRMLVYGIYNELNKC